MRENVAGTDFIIFDESPKAELLPKIYMLPYMLECIKLTGGEAIDVSRTSKNLEHMQTNQAVVLGNYTFSFLSY